jgi:hypothetical protein
MIARRTSTALVKTNDPVGRSRNDGGAGAASFCVTEVEKVCTANASAASSLSYTVDVTETVASISTLGAEDSQLLSLAARVLRNVNLTTGNCWFIIKFHEPIEAGWITTSDLHQSVIQVRVGLDEGGPIVDCSPVRKLRVRRSTQRCLAHELVIRVQRISSCFNTVVVGQQVVRS